jgi:two-component system, OmpR family, sensor histidine kinase SenX3
VISVVVAAVAILIAVVVGVASWRSQQRTARRVVEVVERLGESIPAKKVTTDSAIERLSRSVDRVQRFDDDVRLAEVRLERALNEVEQGIVVCDARGEVVSRNSSSLAFVDARHGEALVEAAVQDLITAALRGRRDTRDLQLHGPPQRTLQVQGAPLFADSELVGAIAVIDDVTEQKRIDAVRRDFVANVSHELKTPIGAIALLAETLADERDVAVAQRLSGRLRDESFRVSRIVDDLLTLSRIEGDDSPRFAHLAVAGIVAEAVARVHAVADHRGVSIEINDIDPGIEVLGDRGQLLSALANLLDNAVKYSEPNSSIEVTVAANREAVSLVVRDYGIGIPSRDLERIFERFYRVDKARSRDTGGTGLGLSIVRHIARNHGGDVTVSSREGSGSTFTLSIPRSAP